VLGVPLKRNKHVSHVISQRVVRDFLVARFDEPAPAFVDRTLLTIVLARLRYSSVL
jgi:hypothetical protein